LAVEVAVKRGRKQVRERLGLELVKKIGSSSMECERRNI